MYPLLKLLGFCVIFINLNYECSASASWPNADDDYDLSTPTPAQQCDTSQIENKLTKLEEYISAERKSMQTQLEDTNENLFNLKEQYNEIYSALTDMKKEYEMREAVTKTFGENKEDHNLLQFEEFTQRMDELLGLLRVVVADVKLNNLDVKSLRVDLSNMENNTRRILTDNQELIKEDLLSKALTDVRHKLSVRHISNEKNQQLEEEKPKTCFDLQTKGKTSGVYTIYPDTFPKGIMVLCEMETSGGGWTVIHNRFDGSQNFHRGFQDYKNGFGNLGGEFWLGLDNIYHLTGSEVNELFIELFDHTSTRKFAHYGFFSLGSETEGFPIKLLGGYVGDAGDSLTYHAGSRFSAKDMDQDEWEEGSCASSHGGAWWFKSCETCNLNGKYLVGELPDSLMYKGMYWGGFRGAQYSLKQARMMIRPSGKST